MRRLLGILAVVFLVPVLAVSGEDTGEYRDDFGSGGYGGNDGNLDWAGPWVESEESDGPKSGAIHIGAENCSNNECLHIEGQGVGQISRSISRRADLSQFADAGLTYDLAIEGAPESTGSLVVEVRGGGSGWKTQTYEFKADSGSYSQSVDVSPWMGSGFEIRFRVDGIIEGDAVAVDRVVVSGRIKVSTSTSSTTSSTSSTTPPATATTTSRSSTPSSNPTTSSSTTIPPRPTATGPARPPTTTEATTTTVPGSSTTTTEIGGVAAPTPPSSGGGLRDSAGGLLADYQSGMMGDMNMGATEVLGAELTAEFSMEVEVFEAATPWIAILALGIAAAMISGVDRRRVPPESKS